MDAKPDFIVAIDYGMTYTGVAYVNLTRGKNVHYIQKWPGRAQASENKVPTVIVYDKSTGAVSSWGFSSETPLEQNNENREYCDWFKTFLDEDYLKTLQALDRQAVPHNHEEVDKWTEDYLRLLYTHVSAKLSSELPTDKPWQNANVEFIFSVPTTWQLSTVEKFKTIVKRAGWHAYRAHSVNIGLTEAEAAAVHVACEAAVIFADNEVMLVCDAGGGTTDLSMMRVSGTQRGVPALKQLATVNGQPIGSTQIDQAFEDLVLGRLRLANEQQEMKCTGQQNSVDLGEAAWSMTKSARFQDAKCCFGLPDDGNFRVLIPSLDNRYRNEEFGIEDGHMSFRLSDLQTIFDEQMDRLCGEIDKQVKSFGEEHPGEQISYLILSGGLGNSAYVQKRLKERYAMNVNTFSNTRNLSVHVGPDPQLAVCKGICLDRIGKLESGRSVLGWRCCRASYGTDCKFLYDPKNPSHIGEALTKDAHDGKDYVMKGVIWFIKKGEPVNVDQPIVERFSRKIKPGDPRAAWQFSDKVITSQLNSDFLPITYGEGTQARVLCKLPYDFSTADEKKFKVKNRHWWSFKEQYMRVEYEVRIVIGAADLTFELWFDGQKLSKDTPIPVEWLPTPAPGPEREHDAAVHVNGLKPRGMKSTISLRSYGIKSSLSPLNSSK